MSNVPANRPRRSREAKQASAGDSCRTGSATHSQESIADLVRDLPRGTHVTAPEVFRRARAAGLNVSLSTVYRVLAIMQAKGDVSSLGGDRGRRWEACDQASEHDHLICLKCGLTIEFVDDLTQGFGKTVAQRKGFDYRASRFDIYGFCLSCKEKDRDHRIHQVLEHMDSIAAGLAHASEQLRQAILLFQNRKIAKGQELLHNLQQNLAGSLADADEAVKIFSSKT